MHQFWSPLHRPDDEGGQDDSGYSAEIARKLHLAYRAIQDGAGRIEGYAKAAELLESLLKWRMSRRQRMRLYFVLSVAYAAIDDFRTGLFWADRALLQALRLEDSASALELFAMRASYNRALLLFDDAILDCHECLEILDRQREQVGLDDPPARLHTLSQLATYAFFAARRELAEHALGEARRLSTLAPDGQFDMASAEWVQAHLYRVQGEPERALRHALGLYDIYVREASRISRDRFEFFVAEVALDWAELLPPGTHRGLFLTLAQTHLGHADRLTHETGDYNGRGLVSLARAHHARLSGAPVDRFRELNAAIRLGDALDDVAILAQAYTALGDEFVSFGEIPSALNSYGRALEITERSQARVFALPARRALLIAREMGH